MKTTALIEIHTGDVGVLLSTLQGGDSHPSPGVVSLSEFVCTKDIWFLERSADLPQVPPSNKYEMVFLSLSPALLDFRALTLPFSSRETLEKVISFELEPLIMDNPGEIVFDFLTLDNTDTGQNVLVAFIRKNVLGDILAALASRGIDPEVVTCLGLLNAVAEGNDLQSIISSLLATLPHDSYSRHEAVGKEITSPSLNFRKGEFTYRKKIENLSRRLKVTALLAVILALLFNLSIALQSFILSGEVAAVAKQTRALYMSLFPQERRIADETYQMKAHLKDLLARGEFLISADPLSFLMDISLKRPGTVAYHEVTINRATVTFKGEAPSAGDVDKIKAALSGVLTEVSSSDIKPLPDGKVSFSFSGRRRQ